MGNFSYVKLKNGSSSSESSSSFFFLLDLISGLTSLDFLFWLWSLFFVEFGINIVVDIGLLGFIAGSASSVEPDVELDGPEVDPIGFISSLLVIVAESFAAFGNFDKRDERDFEAVIFAFFGFSSSKSSSW